jgi:membrane protease subunit (stomatin/prohibitin family)
MRKKMMLLALSLAALAGALTAPSAQAGGTYSCPRCTTYADGSQCCISCVCGSNGFPIACTNNYCAPAGDL